MRTVYLVCENVDLGYNVVKAFTEQSIATIYAKQLDDQHRRDRVVALLKAGYDQESAEEYAKNRREEFFVEEVELA